MATGPDELRDLGRALKALGDKQVRKDTIDSLKRVTAPLTDVVQAEARTVLPQRGGLADVVAQTKVTTKIRLSGRQAGIKLVGRGRVSVDRIDRGDLRHPLFGNRSYWFNQSVRPGWWSRPILEQADRVGRDLEQAIGDGIRRAVR